MLSIASAAYAFAPVTPMAAPSVSRAAAPVMETKADLEALAVKLNPVVGFWDPMNLVEYDQFSAGQEASIGFLRQAEIKHGRVAMAAFVGYLVQYNGIHFPWAISLNGMTFGDISAAGSPPEQWDALPTASKVQILLVIGALEMMSESTNILELSGNKHYMRGGKPGAFPKINTWCPHPVPFELYDPFNLSKNASEEKKAKGLVTEINNGRLAMLGIMGFMAEAAVPGSVPALMGRIAPYSGECMAPFSAGDANLPFVADMLKYQLF
jgi:hypothetical protein